MNISYRWLRDLAPGLEDGPEEVADRLARLGAPADSATPIGAALGDILVARVEASEKHPNADRLTLCRVDAGTGATLDVVCGAPNVREGALYPFAPVGATLPGGVRIRKAKIRGEVSEGMLCSARELGLGHDHTGILELEGDFAPGASFVEAAGLEDTRLELDITADRPDLLSHIGVARALEGVDGVRIAAPPGVGAPLLDDPALESGGAEVASAGVRIAIDDPEACYRFLGAVIEGVEVGPSPAWLAMRLRAVGLRPINNVVDVTNYVTHELGRPMHAYDLDRLEGGEIRVRWARAGEKLRTLDGVDRTLEDGMLVIADGARAVGLAGVMGGEDTEVGEETRTVLLELAHFRPTTVRATRRAAHLSTDASYRFERGVDPDEAERALRRALAMIVALAGGRVRGAIGDAHPTPADRPEVTLRTPRASRLLGVPLGTERVRALLAPIGLEIVRSAAEETVFRVPGHRLADLRREVDLIEEVARHAGYDSFPEERRPIRPTAVPDAPLSLLESTIRDHWVGDGFLEARTAAFAPEAEGDVALLNPLSVEESRLRRSLVPGLATRLAYNQARGRRDLRLFEIGTCFAPALPDEELPRETTRLAAMATGARRPPHWESAAPDWDVWDARGLLETTAELLDVAGRIVPAREAGAGSDIEASLGGGLLAENAAVALVSDSGELVGVAGTVRADAVEAAPWSAPWIALEVLLPPRPDLADRRRLRAIPTHPASERDLALVAATSVPAAAIAEAIRSAAGEVLESIRLFDVYEGGGVETGKRSLAYRLRFQAPDRTLTDAEVDAEVTRVLGRLDEELDVHQRT
jgi:phenylalanyl-tRNA synthetase beta chain